jgi:hypothetical protein
VTNTPTPPPPPRPPPPPPPHSPALTCVAHSYTKEETEKIAFEWQSLLVSAAKGGEPSTYVIEPGIILWSVQVRPPPPC